MEFLPVLLCLLAAVEARNIFKRETEDVPDEGCKCDRRFHRHYPIRGCTVEDLDSCGCPKKFSCLKNTNSSLKVCHFRGQEYPVGSRIHPSDACQVCRCHGGSPPRVSCVTRECPELPATDGDNCHPVYAENKCCPLRFECLGNQIEDDVEAAATKTCKYRDRVYPFGAKVQAADDPCLVCTCDERWVGEDNRTCAELDCVIERHQHKLDEGCVPVYHEGRCCPIEFYCPASLNASLSELPVSEDTNTTHEPSANASLSELPVSDETSTTPVSSLSELPVTEEADKNLDDRCFFANQSYAQGEVLSVEKSCLKCSCMVPPDLTCVRRTCSPPPADWCSRIDRPEKCCPEYECMLGDQPAEEECPTPMCEHVGCRVAVPPGEKCPTCVCGEMVSELEHNHLEQQAMPSLQQVVQGVEEMDPPAQFSEGADDSSEGGLQLMPLTMERRVRQLSNSSSEEESDKEINEEDVDDSEGLSEPDGEQLRGASNGSLIINEIFTIDHEVEVPPGCPTPLCEGSWCKIIIPEGHNCPTCVCKGVVIDNEP